MNKLFAERLLLALDLIGYWYDRYDEQQFYVFLEKDSGLDLEQAYTFLKIIEDKFPTYLKIEHIYDIANEEHWIDLPEDPSMVRPFAEVVLRAPFSQLEKAVTALVAGSDGKGLENKEISYNKKSSQLIIGDDYIDIAPDSQEALILEILLQNDPGEFIDWSIVMEKVTGEELPDRRARKSFFDTVSRLNSKVQSKLLTEEKLFGRKENHIRRNF